MKGELPRISRELGQGAIAPRHGKCAMRGSESLTIKAICFEGDFRGHFSCMKSEIFLFISDKKVILYRAEVETSGHEILLISVDEFNKI